MYLKTKLPKQKMLFLIKSKSKKKEEQTGFEEKYVTLNESNSLENNHFVDILPSYSSGESAIIVGRRSRTDHYCTRDD